MTTLTVNQIEEQFAHLSSEDQLSLLDRLAHHHRLGVAGRKGLPGRFPGALYAAREIHHKEDHEECNSADSDLLSEAW